MTTRAAPIPTEVFAGIREDPVPTDVAERFHDALRNMARGGGMAATVMCAAGTWSDATGKADGVRDLRVDDQFAVASITKSVVAAQVLQLVEAGGLGLDDAAAVHLPAGLDFDANGATVRQLLGMRSGIPDYVDSIWESLSVEPMRAWEPADLLHAVPADRSPPGGEFRYSSTNYLLLGLIIEQVAGRAVADVLRRGVLDHPGLERLVYQPHEAPSDPMAMPAGASTGALRAGGGFLPSLAGVTSAGPAGAMASDSRCLARWWRALCAAEIVSPESLRQMAPLPGGYGLGMCDVASPDARSVGHTGEHVGFAAWAACLLDHGAVVVVLSNRAVDDVTAIARPMVDAVTRPLL